MKKFVVIMLAGASYPMSSFAVQNFYCPQNHAFISIGMTQDQVSNACGAPLSKQTSNSPATQKIPMTQLIFNNQGTNTAFYGVWKLPIGSGGARLEVDVVNNKVHAIRINGNNSNSFSICGSNNIQAGDSVAAVYNACGVPSLVNNTYLKQTMPGSPKPEQWVYQMSQYQSPVSLTFVNGKLQSIDQ